MTTIITNDDFTRAVDYLITANLLPVQGERFCDPFARKVFDERGAGVENVIDITPDTPTLESALDSANATLSVATSETTQADNAKTALQALMTGLHGLSADDKSYAIACRIMAKKDGMDNQTIMAIVDRPTAVAYITSKPEWTGATAATRALVGDVLEMVAGITQVLLLVIT